VRRRNRGARRPSVRRRNRGRRQAASVKREAGSGSRHPRRRLDIAPATLAPQGGPMAGNSSMARSAQVLRFVLQHRGAGLFSGPDFDASDERASPAAGDDGERGPEAFVRDLEALGPTFIKVGQSLSTRHDMVPPPYLAALERMQDDVLPVPAADI